MDATEREQVSKATDHAMAVGREAVAAGLLESEAVRRLYQEYTDFLRKGARGTFIQLLRSRQALDEAALRQLEERVPAGALRGRASGKFNLPPGDTAARAPRPGSETVDDDEVLPPPGAPAPLPGLATVDDDEVLDIGERTLEVAVPDRILPLPHQTAGGQTASQTHGGQTHGGQTHGGQTHGGAAPARHTQEVPIPAAAEMTMEVAPPSDPLPAPAGEEEEEEEGVIREPRVGEVLGDFELLEILGRGGMGVIYKVKKRGTGEIYALKTLLMVSAANLDRERFLQEVEALRRLDSPGIVSVHGHGRTDGIDWYVMDYVQGQELKELMAAGSLRPNERLRIFEDICKAMEHAHERGIVHRDLKPANVVVDEEGKVLVLDFGVAKLADEDQSLTRTGAMLGTPYYMAPEQVMNPKGVDARADVYALGAMLFEMMTGQVPFPGQTFGEVADKIMHEQPATPSKLEPKLHVDFDTIVLKALEKERDRRHPDVTALRLEVARYRRGRRQGVSPLDQAQEALRRFWEKHQVGILAGFGIASLIYIPIIIFVS